MIKNKKLFNLNKNASGTILDVKGILEALSELEQDSYPVNILIEIAKRKVTKAFYYVEKNRKILKIID